VRTALAERAGSLGGNVDTERLAMAIRDRLGDTIKDRLGDAIKVRLGEAISERMSETFGAPRANGHGPMPLESDTALA
jgi:hypothetical protein